MLKQALNWLSQVHQIVPQFLLSLANYQCLFAYVHPLYCPNDSALLSYHHLPQKYHFHLSRLELYYKSGQKIVCYNLSIKTQK